jgi:hypothetical protein
MAPAARYARSPSRSCVRAQRQVASAARPGPVRPLAPLVWWCQPVPTIKAAACPRSRWLTRSSATRMVTVECDLYQSCTSEGRRERQTLSITTRAEEAASPVTEQVEERPRAPFLGSAIVSLGNGFLKLPTPWWRSRRAMVLNLRCET